MFDVELRPFATLDLLPTRLRLPSSLRPTAMPLKQTCLLRQPITISRRGHPTVMTRYDCPIQHSPLDLLGPYRNTLPFQFLPRRPSNNPVSERFPCDFHAIFVLSMLSDCALYISFLGR